MNPLSNTNEFFCLFYCTENVRLYIVSMFNSWIIFIFSSLRLYRRTGGDSTVEVCAIAKTNGTTQSLRWQLPTGLLH
jgi:hypothetical protein